MPTGEYRSSRRPPPPRPRLRRPPPPPPYWPPPPPPPPWRLPPPLPPPLYRSCKTFSYPKEEFGSRPGTGASPSETRTGQERRQKRALVPQIITVAADACNWASRRSWLLASLV